MMTGTPAGSPALERRFRVGSRLEKGMQERMKLKSGHADRGAAPGAIGPPALRLHVHAFVARVRQPTARESQQRLRNCVA